MCVCQYIFIIYNHVCKCIYACIHTRTHSLDTIYTNVYMPVHIHYNHLYKWIYACIHIYITIYTNVSMHVCIHPHVYIPHKKKTQPAHLVHIHICMHTNMYAYKYVRMNICMFLVYAHVPPEKLFGDGFSTPIPLFCLICTIISNKTCILD